jgi:hypothetical protein
MAELLHYSPVARQSPLSPYSAITLHGVGISFYDVQGFSFTGRWLYFSKQFFE